MSRPITTQIILCFVACLGAACTSGTSGGPSQGMDAQNLSGGDGGELGMELPAAEVDALRAPITDVGSAFDGEGPDEDGNGFREPETRQEPVEITGGILLVELDAPPIRWATAGARYTAGSGEEVSQDECQVAWSDPDADTPPGFGYDAGVLTVSGTDPSVTFTPVDEGSLGTGYVSDLPEDLETLLPSGGALLTIEGAGGLHIGPYTTVLQTPEPVVLLEPATGLAGLGLATAGTGGDLLVQWVPGNGDTTLVSLSPIGADWQIEAGYGMTCVLAGDPGSATVPQWALAEVRGDDGTRRVALAVTRVKSKSAEAPGATVSVGATRTWAGLLDLIP